MSPFNVQLGTFYYEPKSFIQLPNYVEILIFASKCNKQEVALYYDDARNESRYLKMKYKFGNCKMRVVKEMISYYSNLWGVKLRLDNP